LLHVRCTATGMSGMAGLCGSRTLVIKPLCSIVHRAVKRRQPRHQCWMAPTPDVSRLCRRVRLQDRPAQLRRSRRMQNENTTTSSAFNEYRGVRWLSAAATARNHAARWALLQNTDVCGIHAVREAA
jgi:hypothetical protein